MLDGAIICLLPTLVVIVLSAYLKRATEPLIAGCVVGYILIAPSEFGSLFLQGLGKSLANETVGWIILVIMLFGALIQLLIHSGGAKAFARYLGKAIKNRAHALLATWFLGLAIFIDDYLNALAVGSSMQGLADKYKISRAMLAYVVDTTAAPICILLPFSTWAVYVAGLLESNQLAEKGQGLDLYISAIPYMSYAWIALAMPVLMAFSKLPLLGVMARAESESQKVEEKKQSEEPQLQNGDDRVSDKDDAGFKPALDFILPMLALIGFTWLFDVDVLKGAAVTLVLTIVWLRVRGGTNLLTLFDSSWTGAKQMFEVAVILVLSFVLKDINDQLKLTDFILDNSIHVLNATTLPVVTFLALSLIAFCTGSFWGLYAIAFPIVIPLAQSFSVDMSLMIGAVVSAGAFGSHACFYSDSTVLSAKACGCEPIEHALSQLPYALFAAAMAAVVLVLLSV